MPSWFRRDKPSSQARKSSSPNAESLPEKTAIILVIGSAGSGKSSFVSSATGVIDGSPKPQSLKPGEDIGTLLCHVPTERRKQTQQILLVDTPGLDSCDNVSTDLLTWLASKYADVENSAIVYLHKITNPRLTDQPPAQDHIEKFRRLPGKPKALLATTMWSSSNSSDPKLKHRESQLENQYWKAMIEQGAKMAQFHNSHSSAWDIIMQVVD